MFSGVRCFSAGANGNSRIAEAQKIKLNNG
jgi:hypothetical protein